MEEKNDNPIESEESQEPLNYIVFWESQEQTQQEQTQQEPQIDDLSFSESEHKQEKKENCIIWENTINGSMNLKRLLTFRMTADIKRFKR